MEACCRHLRDGAVKDEAGCAMVLVCDHLGCVGGPELMHRLCSDYLQALAQQRAQASHVRLLQLENSLPASITAHRAVHALDYYTDPDGWLSEVAGGQQPQSSCCRSYNCANLGSHPRIMALSAPGSLHTLLDHLTSAFTTTPATTSNSASAAFDHVPGAAALTASLPSISQQPLHSVCVIVDCLTPLLLRHPLPRVLRFLHSLREHPSVSCVLASLHKDAHSQHIVDGIQHAATCTVELQPVGGLQVRARVWVGVGVVWQPGGML
ncbi:hypothetical protein DUNSADRAFT_10760 [Dunaliella salina]|uniref:Elongator complex protein 5 n=1 Tax=Dunaliella salina TaxID=3046 RepID=A0ABQ7GEN3_DUNSA|nr:hypothetical protein DUNSADRAFT_10760 [Dunaliella salina]|eukprot:KAF5833054.1 hypothetical protein DUNSADRAFT_10760 [Dunaliella salina]